MSSRSRIVLAAISAGLLLTTAPAMSMDWREANKASATQIEAGNLAQAAALAEQAADLYAATADPYRPEAHAQLVLNLTNLRVETVAPLDLPGSIRRAMSGLEKKVGEEHPLLLQFWKQVIVAQGRAGQHADAKLSHTRAIYLAQKNDGPGSMAHVQALIDASAFYRSVDGAGPARTFLTQAEDATGSLAPDHPLRSLVRFHMAKLYLESGDLKRAEEGYNAVLASTAAMRNPVETDLRRISYGHLAYLYKRRGDTARMEEIIQRTAELPFPEGEPQPLLRTEPDIPPGAWRISRSGHVKVRYTISGEGRVKDVEILENSGTGQFVRNVEKALAEWRYQPRVVDGRPVDSPGQLAQFTYAVENETPDTGSRLHSR